MKDQRQIFAIAFSSIYVVCSAHASLTELSEEAANWIYRVFNCLNASGAWSRTAVSIRWIGSLLPHLQRWVAEYRKSGLAALARKSRLDRGTPRIVSPRINAAIEGLALERPPLPIRSIYRKVRQFAEASGESMTRYGPSAPK